MTSIATDLITSDLITSDSIAPEQLSTNDANHQLQAGFHALSDPIRFQVLEILKEGERCVCDLNHQLHLSQSRLSFHLRVLKEAKLVTVRQDGRWSYYSLNPSGFAPLQSTLALFQTAHRSTYSTCP